VLFKLGYIPVPSKAEHIVSESIKESLESSFGQAASAVLLNNLSSIYGLSKNELTTNYDIFEKSLYKISGYGAKIILGYLKKEILIKALAASSDSEITEQDIVNSEVGIGDIIKKLVLMKLLNLFIEYHQVCILFLFMKMRLPNIKY
jgi:hypothetical protein